MELNSPQTVLKPGTQVVFPNALPTSRAYDQKLRPDWLATLAMLNVDANQPQADKIVVDKSDKVLKAYDKAGKLIALFQVTTGSTHDPLPIGTWKINGADYNPKFHYNPALFWDAKKDDKKAMLPPGPNGPVGVVWLDLSKPHYGIHGTPVPELIGRTASHGCVRLANWNAARLAMMVKPGTPVVFQE
jgi:lipoprotein-anchoring transpeptidase ErfK/SrfK